jgi:hypothetical protein
LLTWIMKSGTVVSGSGGGSGGSGSTERRNVCSPDSVVWSQHRTNYWYCMFLIRTGWLSKDWNSILVPNTQANMKNFNVGSLNFSWPQICTPPTSLSEIVFWNRSQKLPPLWHVTLLTLPAYQVWYHQVVSHYTWYAARLGYPLVIITGSYLMTCIKTVLVLLILG